jgi:acyl-coenzyme A synthetase/AMP-(fatty) acid ligase
MDKLGINLLKHHENTALIVRNERREKISYGNLLKQVLKATLFVESENIPKYSVIGFYGDKSLALVTITLAIIETDYPFCYITKDDLDDLNVEYFFSLTKHCHLDTVELQKSLIICDTTIYFYKSKISKEIKQFNHANDDMNKICYRITTSGSTGKRKLIYVTYNSINPNIKSLQNIFKLDHTDVIYSASPITFDVFIIDLFLALHSGASLLFMPDNHRFDTSIYCNDTNESVTFLQMTPTIFRQYGLDNISNKILHAESSLK